MDFAIYGGYGGLFLAAFLAATVVPAQSETLLSLLVMSENYPIGLLITIASIGNILGAWVNWRLGMGIQSFRHKAWFPINESSLEKAKAWYGYYGRWSLLLSWVPFIGDPLTIAAGVMREKLWVFIPLVAIGKIGRYCVIAYAVMP